MQGDLPQCWIARAEPHVQGTVCEPRRLVATESAIIDIQVAGKRSLAKDEFRKYNLQGALRMSERSLTRDRNRIGTPDVS